MLYHFYLAVIVHTASKSGKRNSTPFSFALSSPCVPSSLLYVLAKSWLLGVEQEGGPRLR
jgi:hypothetical protein